MQLPSAGEACPSPETLDMGAKLLLHSQCWGPPWPPSVGCPEEGGKASVPPFHASHPAVLPSRAAWEPDHFLPSCPCTGAPVWAQFSVLHQGPCSTWAPRGCHDCPPPQSGWVRVENLGVWPAGARLLVLRPAGGPEQDHWSVPRGCAEFRGHLLILLPPCQTDSVPRIRIDGKSDTPSPLPVLPSPSWGPFSAIDTAHKCHECHEAQEG